MSDQVASWIRTNVPYAIAAALAWLAANAGIVVDEKTSQGLMLGTAGLVLAVYYAAARKLEQRWPGAGWLLGLAKAPKYPESGRHVAIDAPLTEGPAETLIPLSEAQRMAEEAATEAYRQISANDD